MTETVVYVHGAVGPRFGRHTDEYRALREGLAERGVRLPPWEESVAVEWGWPTEAAGATGALGPAQARLAELVDRAPSGDRWSGWLVEPIRDLILFGWADVAFYLDAEGRRRTRRVVWEAILARLPEGPTDLTLVGHSLGAVLAHDFLFHLYSGRREESREHYAPQALWEAAEARCRVRRLVTMGNPLVPLLVRSPRLVDRMAARPPPWLDLADIGLGRPCHSGEHPVWLNVWDRHDVLSFPVEGLYRHGGEVLDLYPDHSDWPPRAHRSYWRSGRVHAVLADHWG